MVKKIEYGHTDMGGPRHYYRENLIVNLVKEIKSEGLILDAGCGDGSLSLALAKYGFKVKAFDSAEGCATMLGNKARNAHLSEYIDCRQGDVREIRFLSDTFDIIVCGEVLEHVHDDRKAVREFNRVLKTGGICVVTVPVHPGFWDISDVFAGHVRRYTKQGLFGLFRDNGFEIDKVFFWGFPLMLLYHKTVFLFWVRLMKYKNDYERDKSVFTKIGKSPFLSLLIANIFKIDNLFFWLPWGIGVALRARKVKDLN